MVVTNIGLVACKRDVGAAVLAAYVYSLDNKRLWSNLDCAPSNETLVKTFAPGEQVTTAVTWTGMGSAPHCPLPRPAIGPGTYNLVVQLGNLRSPCGSVHLGSAATSGRGTACAAARVARTAGAWATARPGARSRRLTLNSGKRIADGRLGQLRQALLARGGPRSRRCPRPLPGRPRWPPAGPAASRTRGPDGRRGRTGAVESPTSPGSRANSPPSPALPPSTGIRKPLPPW